MLPKNRFPRESDEQQETRNRLLALVTKQKLLLGNFLSRQKFVFPSQIYPLKWEVKG